MNLTGEQTQQLQNAFLDTYSRDDLEQFVAFKLDERLNNITSAGAMRQTVFELIEWAERHGRLKELIEAAHSERPHHEVFAALSQSTESRSEEERVAEKDEISEAEQNSPSKRPLWRMIGWSITAIGLIASVMTIVTYCKPPVIVVPVPTPTSEINEPFETSEFTYGVKVVDVDTSQSIANAQVTIEIGGKAPLDEFADSNGFARVVVPTAFAEQSGRLIVTADGYESFRQEINLYPERLPDTVRLKRSN